MATFVFSNNCQTQLAAPITTAGQTTIVLASSANIPSIPAGDYWVLTLNDALTGNTYEIVWVTGAVGATLTVLRGQEGTAAATWLVGDNAYATDTAAVLNNFVALSPLSVQSGNISVSGSVSGGGATFFNVAINGTGIGATVTGIGNSGAGQMIFNVPGGQGYSFQNAGGQVGSIASTGLLTFPAIVVTSNALSPSTAVGISNDIQATPGLVFNSPTGSTRGYSWVIGGNTGTTVALLSAAGQFQATSYVSAGYNAQSGVLGAGDIGAARSTTTGVLRVGGSSASLGLDFNITNALGTTFFTAASVYTPIFAGVYMNSSDESLKNNIVPIESGTAEILALNPVSFTLKKGTIPPFAPAPIEPLAPLAPLPDGATEEDIAQHAEQNAARIANHAELVAMREQQAIDHEAFCAWHDDLPEQPGHGFIAQHVETVLPALVSTDNNGLKGVQYDGIIPFLVKAFQEEHAVRVGMQAALKAAGIKGF